MEFNDVVNDKDEVIGTASHKEIYENKLPHRIVHVLIFNSKGEMLLQKRSATKSFCPNHWCTAAGGHVQSSESYEEAAIRELEEELGISAPVKFMFKTKYYRSADFFKFLEIFKAVCEGPFEINTDEVESVKWFSKEKLNEEIANGGLFHPELKFLLQNYADEIFAE
jgi:isopentenyl-diphosphate delta-isomerase